jgi:SAM-dependent methyltransferase
VDHKLLVARGYDRIAEGLRRHTEAREFRRKRGYLAELLDGLPASARILDLGCGAGDPVLRDLHGHYRVLGVDMSRGQLELARRAAPGAGLLLADMGALPLRNGSFDAILAFYSIIHVPRDEHGALLRSLFELLGNGGRLLAVLGARAWEGAEDDWLGLGATMWWSHWDAETELRLVREAGFRIIRSRYEGDHLDDSQGGHTFVLAERSG